MGKLQVDSAHYEDLTAIIRGRNEEVNEESIKKYAEAHPEWKVVNASSGVVKIGSDDENHQAEETEAEYMERILNPNKRLHKKQ
jgi:hypothetical protein